MSLYQRSRDFILHRFLSKTRHGVHSPFVYSLIDQCIYSTKPTTPASITAYFNQLKRDQRLIKGMDYGQRKETSVPIATYAKRSAMPQFQVALMHRLVHYLKPASILELGTNLGKSLAAMASANPNSRAEGVEGNAALTDIANNALRECQLRNAHVSCAAFDSFFAANTSTFDFIFLDGDHHYEPTMRYFNRIKTMLNPGGVIVLHDLYYSAGMKRAWSEIKKDRSVTITVDLFFFGLVWMGKNQAKEHFSIRFPASLFRVFF